MSDQTKATITCPHCGQTDEVDIPRDRCLAFHQCSHCDETVSVPKGSNNCCVICEYSDTTCPTAANSAGCAC